MLSLFDPKQLIPTSINLWIHIKKKNYIDKFRTSCTSIQTVHILAINTLKVWSVIITLNINVLVLKCEHVNMLIIISTIVHKSHR